jgi:hypothetical protein
MSAVQQTDSNEMRQRLREFYARDAKYDWANLKRLVADPVRPQNQKGRFRPHPVIVLLGTVVFTAVGAFLCFSNWRP